MPSAPRPGRGRPPVKADAAQAVPKTEPPGGQRTAHIESRVPRLEDGGQHGAPLSAAVRRGAGAAQPRPQTERGWDGKASQPTSPALPRSSPRAPRCSPGALDGPHAAQLWRPAQPNPLPPSPPPPEFAAASADQGTPRPKGSGWAVRPPLLLHVGQSEAPGALRARGPRGSGRKQVRPLEGTGPRGPAWRRPVRPCVLLTPAAGISGAPPGLGAWSAFGGVSDISPRGPEGSTHPRPRPTLPTASQGEKPLAESPSSLWVRPRD